LVLGHPMTVVVWLLFCFFAGLTATSYVPRRRLAISVCLGAFLAIPVAFYLWSDVFLSPFYREVFGYPFSHISPGIGFLCLSMACAGYGGVIPGRGHSRRFCLLSGALGLGIVLLAWALPRWLSGEAFAHPGEEGHWLLWPMVPGDRLLWGTIPGLAKDVAVMVSGACLITAALGVAGFPKFRRGRRRRVPTNQAEDKRKEAG
jgi:hypothetical protein